MQERSSEDIRLDDLIRLRKPHPCGSDIWVVVRVGAEIGLRCTGCRRRILMPRSQLRKRMKGFVDPTESDAGHTSS